MPIDTQTYPSSQLTVFTVLGEVPFVDYASEVKKFYSNEPTRNTLWDLTQANVWKINAKDLESILAHVMKEYDDVRKGGKTALVTRDNHTVNLCRFIKYVAEMDNASFEVKIFSTISEAKDWLGFKKHSGDSSS